MNKWYSSGGADSIPSVVISSCYVRADWDFWFFSLIKKGDHEVNVATMPPRKMAVTPEPKTKATDENSKLKTCQVNVGLLF